MQEPQAQQVLHAIVLARGELHVYAAASFPARRLKGDVTHAGHNNHPQRQPRRRVYQVPGPGLCRHYLRQHMGRLPHRA